MSTRRSGFILYSEKNSLDGDRIAIALVEKNVAYDRIYVDIANPPDELLDINTQLILPTLEMREVSLYYPDIILAFLDERFPHPPLLPNDPINRGKFRLTLRRILDDWYPLIEKNIAKGTIDRKTTKAIIDLLTQYSTLFQGYTYFQSHDFTMIDVALAPFFWWLTRFDVMIPENLTAIHDYKRNLLERRSIIHTFEKYN